jgi:hypothetical protein
MKEVTLSESIQAPTPAITEAPLAASPVESAVTEPTSPSETVDPSARQADATATPQDKISRRIANLTRKMADEARAREAAERRADAAESLLNAGKEETTPRQQQGQDVESRAAKLVEEREFNKRLSDIDSSGKQELGQESWEAAKATLTGLGATSNQAFLQALAEAENPAKLFAHFADDTDALMDLLAKSPAALAARIGRLDAKLGVTAGRALSSAPVPPPKVSRASVVAEPTPTAYPKDMSMKSWSAMMDSHLPKSLGGTKKR